MGWLSAIKKAVTAPVKIGLAPVKLTANIARHPTAIRSHLRAGVAAGLMPLRMAAATTKVAARTAARMSPHALVAHRLRAAATRAPTTPFQQGGSSGGGGGGGDGYAAEGYDEEDEMIDAPDDGADDGGDDDEGLGGIDYAAYLDDGRQLAGWTDDLQKIGVNLAKGAASGLLTSVGRQLTPSVAAPPPKPPGMSTTAKLAIGAGLAIPVLFVLTRRRSSAPVAV